MKLSTIATSFAIANIGRLASAQFMDAVVDYAIKNLAPPNITIPGLIEPNSTDSTGTSLFGDRKLKGSFSERPKGRKLKGKAAKGDEAFKDCPCWDDTSLDDLDPCDVSSVWIGASILGIGFEKDTPYFELAWATSVFSDGGDKSATLDEEDGLERFKANLGEESGKSRRALSNEASTGRQDERKLVGDLYDFGDRVYSTWVPTGQCGYFPGFDEWWMAFTEETNEKEAGLKSRQCTRETGDALYQWADDNDISCNLLVSWCIGIPRSAFTHGYLGTIFGCPGPIVIPCAAVFDR